MESYNRPMEDYSAAELLDDGSPVVVRAIRPEDKTALVDAFNRLSPESAYARFFRFKNSLSRDELKYFTEVDFSKHVAIGVALVETEDPLPIGIGRYVEQRDDDRPSTLEQKNLPMDAVPVGSIKSPRSAEVAFTVDDGFQGIGVGSLLLKHLRKIAMANGILIFRAFLLAGNERMLHVFQRSGLEYETVPQGEVIEVIVKLQRSSDRSEEKL